MVLKILPYVGVLYLDWNTSSGKNSATADARRLQNLGRLNRPSREDDFAGSTDGILNTPGNKSDTLSFPTSCSIVTLGQQNLVGFGRSEERQIWSEGSGLVVSFCCIRSSIVSRIHRDNACPTSNIASGEVVVVGFHPKGIKSMMPKLVRCGIFLRIRHMDWPVVANKSYVRGGLRCLSNKLTGLVKRLAFLEKWPIRSVSSLSRVQPPYKKFRKIENNHETLKG